MIAVDASVALKLVLEEPGSTAAREQWQRWTDSCEVLIAPVLFCAETFSGLRQSVYSGRLSQEGGDKAYTILGSLTVELREPSQLYPTAWQFAQLFQRPTVYDCRYLALAAITQCQFWTADRRLANAVGSQLQWLHLLET